MNESLFVITYTRDTDCQQQEEVIVTMAFINVSVTSQNWLQFTNTNTTEVNMFAIKDISWEYDDSILTIIQGGRAHKFPWSILTNLSSGADFIALVDTPNTPSTYTMSVVDNTLFIQDTVSNKVVGIPLHDIHYTTTTDQIHINTLEQQYKYDIADVTNIANASEFLALVANAGVIDVQIDENTTATELTAFQHPLVVNDIPIFDGNFVYHNNPEVWETYTLFSGTSSNTDSLATIETGVTPLAYSVLRSQEYLVNRTGEGMSTMITAAFPTGGVANSQQGCGFMAVENSILFGYVNTLFGVFIRSNGKMEIQTLTLTTPAAGAETASVTLNGVLYNVPITAGTVEHNAYEIAQFAYTEWQAYQQDDTVVFHFMRVGNLPGAFTYSSTGASAGTFAETRAGALGTDTFIPQTSWNMDVMDGTGPSGMTLDPAVLNVYKIDLQWMATGTIKFKILNPECGQMVTVHILRHSNSSTMPMIVNPTFKVGWVAGSFGSTTNIMVQGGAVQIANQGKLPIFYLNETYSLQVGSIGPTLTNLYTLRLDGIFQDKISQVKVVLQSIDMSEQGQNQTIASVRLIKGADVAGSPNFTKVGVNSPMSVDVDGTTVTGGTVVRVFNLTRDDSKYVDLTPYQITLRRTERITVCATSSLTGATFRVSLNYYIIE